MQHRATRLVRSIKKRSYDERIKVLKLATLETRRKRGDLIKFYKIINKLDGIKRSNELVEINRGVNSRPAGNTRSQGVCFHAETGAKISTVRDNFFTNRAMPLWNDLPVKVKEARTLNSVKAGLDRLKLFMI